jgi:FMN phosphatase YigB (HAD superfamily)
VNSSPQIPDQPGCPGLQRRRLDVLHRIELLPAYKLHPEIPADLEMIRRIGLKIGLIGNTSGRGQVPTNLTQYNLKHFFDPIVLSSKYGHRKPDPAIFHYAAKLVNFPTSHWLYIGDRIAQDILGTRKTGFCPAMQIKHDFDHGESDEGATPDFVIEHMIELVDIIQAGMKCITPCPQPVDVNPCPVRVRL